MADTPKFDAELRDAQPYRGQTWMGKIYNDSKGRWVDGTNIRTSPAVEWDGDVLQTLNTRYLVTRIEET